MSTEMRRKMPGLYDGEVVRAERIDGRWATQVKVRDVGHVLGLRTGYYEHHADGQWMNVGSYARLKDCKTVAERIVSGSHLLHAAHANDLGHVPAQVIPFSAAENEIRLLTET